MQGTVSFGGVSGRSGDEYGLNTLHACIKLSKN